MALPTNKQKREGEKKVLQVQLNHNLNSLVLHVYQWRHLAEVRERGLESQCNMLLTDKHDIWV